MTSLEAAALRNALVDELSARGYVRSAAVEAALRRVPRHLFVPWLTLSDAYADAAFRDPDSTPETDSSVSQPTAVAMMLEAFDVRPGMRVLEIGAGSGYNAALLAHLVGEGGHVVTVDLEAFLVEKARRQLAAAGFGRVEVIHGDGALGYPPAAPYDRIVATVGLSEVPPAWPEQLAPGGKIVAPLHLGGEAPYHVLVSLERKDGYLEGVGLESLRMVLFRGPGAGHNDAVEERRGSDWRGAPHDALRLRIYPKDAAVPLEPQQKHLLKRGSLTVLEPLVQSPP
jgi:protein-L-isoaspartate(D-aspartate) O-methyltransferase